MERLSRLLCLALLLALVPIWLNLRQMLPADRQALLEKKYDSWSGVLRLWYCEGWPPGAGSASPWLNRCVSAFEKAHPGVYVQTESIGEETLLSWNDPSMAAPDLLLFPPGLLETPAGLAPLRPTRPPLESLARLGDWDGIGYALPVAMGGYMRIEGALGEGVAVPADEPGRLWRVALAATPLPEEVSADEAPGLPGRELELGLPASVPAGSAFRRFCNGEAGALLGSQREVVRLTALDAQDKGPEWSVAAVSAFTDQLLFVAVPRSSSPERQALAAQFAAGLLSEESQAELNRAGLFSVTSTASGYGPGDPLALPDVWLRRQALVAPGAFGTAWRREAAALADAWQSRAPAEFVDALRHCLAQR